MLVHLDGPISVTHVRWWNIAESSHLVLLLLVKLVKLKQGLLQSLLVEKLNWTVANKDNYLLALVPPQVIEEFCCV